MQKLQAGLEHLGENTLGVEAPTPRQVVGVVGQLLWTGRFAVQWWISEHRRASVLPPVFWVMGTAGSLLLLTYAIVRRDLVFTLAYAFAPIPNVRNLWLERCSRSTKELPA